MLNGTQRADLVPGDAYPNNLLARNGVTGQIGPLGHKWGPVFFDHLALAVQLHGVTEVWVFDHLDCGMYKSTLKLETDEDPSIHLKQQQDLKKLLASKHPNLKFKGYLIAVNGGISQII